MTARPHGGGPISDLEGIGTGFRTVAANSVRLEVNQKGRLDLKLELGTAQDTITVEAAASPVETETLSKA